MHHSNDSQPDTSDDKLIVQRTQHNARTRSHHILQRHPLTSPTWSPAPLFTAGVSAVLEQVVTPVYEVEAHEQHRVGVAGQLLQAVGRHVPSDPLVRTLKHAGGGGGEQVRPVTAPALRGSACW